MIDSSTLLGIAVVFATLLGPIFAVQAQTILDKTRSQEARRIAIFRTLLTRRLDLSLDNVHALNAVPIEFYGVGAIIEALRAYLAHLGTPIGAPAWSTRRVDLFFDLLQKIAECVGFEFNLVQLKDDYYRPNLHVTAETDQETIRHELAQILAGTKSLPMEVKGFPADAELNALLKKWLKQQLGI